MDNATEWTIQEIARLTGTTSRTLRHYDAIGLLTPSRVAANGYRCYDEQALVRLQRILLLRELGLGLPQIGAALTRSADERDALREHVRWLEGERARITRQIAAVTSTITRLTEGNGLMAEEMFDGFDHTAHRDEVIERWGETAWQRSDAWWRGMSDAARADWQQSTSSLGADWTAAAETGIDPEGAVASALAERHVAWLRSIPGTPAADGVGLAAYLAGLGDMYVSDPRFAANYGGEHGARFVRDALHAYVIAHLS